MWIYSAAKLITMRTLSTIRNIGRLCLAFVVATAFFNAQTRLLAATPDADTKAGSGFVDAAAFGFSPENNGSDNARSLQRAVDRGGTIVVSHPGTYLIADTVYIGSHTSLIFGNNVFLKKIAEHGFFPNVLLNKGALTKTYDEQIVVEGLNIIVNGVDEKKFQVYGLRGQLAFFYVKDLRIEHFRCLDLGQMQFAIQVCTFEDLIINDVIIKGDKDGIHLGPGKRFHISNGIFQTFDDAVALNGHDYASSNPELGWIEDGVVENCHDLYAERSVGYFCRMLAGAWTDWQRGMTVQNSDTVISGGRLYRVQAKPDGTVYTSVTQPAFSSGSKILDGIPWGMAQTNVIYTAGVRNITFRDIYLEKPRVGFSIYFDNSKYSRSYYPGAQTPIQEHVFFDDIRVLYDQKVSFLSIGTPVDVVTIANSSFQNNSIEFVGTAAMPDYLKTKVNLNGCVFNWREPMELLVNSVPNKSIVFKTSGSAEVSDNFSATVAQGKGNIKIISDLTGLKE